MITGLSTILVEHTLQPGKVPFTDTNARQPADSVEVAICCRQRLQVGYSVIAFALFKTVGNGAAITSEIFWK